MNGSKAVLIAVVGGELAEVADVLDKFLDLIAQKTSAAQSGSR